MPGSNSPTFRELSDAECRSLLKQSNVGRIAFIEHNRVDIEPIHFVYLDDHIFGRTTPGTKVHALAHRPYVAFEIDEVRALYDWDSVVAHGTIYFLPDDDGSALDLALRERALEALRQLVPAALRAHDPTPARQILFTLTLHELTGRSARPGTG